MEGPEVSAEVEGGRLSASEFLTQHLEGVNWPLQYRGRGLLWRQGEVIEEGGSYVYV